MMTDKSRRRMFASAGLADPIPSIDQQRLWCWKDDRVPPEGEPDGQFDSFVTWVHKAASWIGWSGAACYDTKDRPCRNGGDMQRARDEGAFPVRWYWPERFPDPVVVRERTLRIRKAVADGGPDGRTLDEIRVIDGLKRVTMTEIAREAAGRYRLEGDRIVPTEEGSEETRAEEGRAQRAGWVRA